MTIYTLALAHPPFPALFIPTFPVTPSACLPPHHTTVGWFARDATVLQQVGSTLFHSPSLAPSSSSSTSSASSSLRPFTGWLVAEDAFELADKDAARAIYDKIAPHIDEIAAVVGGRPQEMRVAGDEGSEVGGVHEWVEAMRVLQVDPGAAWPILTRMPLRLPPLAPSPTSHSPPDQLVDAWQGYATGSGSQLTNTPPSVASQNSTSLLLACSSSLLFSPPPHIPTAGGHMAVLQAVDHSSPPR
ncbi:unnamed protein product, partial [Closterium sp. NIES-54]